MAVWRHNLLVYTDPITTISSYDKYTVCFVIYLLIYYDDYDVKLLSYERTPACYESALEMVWKLWNVLRERVGDSMDVSSAKIALYKYKNKLVK